MSILGDLDSLILRETAHPPLITKGSELTYAEWDARTIAIYDAVQSIVSGANVTAYNAGTTYDAASTDVYLKFAGYDSRIWKAIGTHTGETPSEGIYWTQITVAELIPNLMVLAEMGAGQSPCTCIKQAKVTITSAQLLSINFTPIQIIPASAGSFIEVVSASVSIDFNTTAYNTNTNLILLPSGGEKILESDVLGLTSVTSLDTIKFTSVQGTTPRDVAINVSVETDSPIGGDSDITVYVTYREITP